MAITKYKVIKKNLEAVINYAKNGEKTENGILVTGINCLPDIAYNQMTLTKKSFHKEDGRLGYHIIQSFKENEVSPEQCNKIGVELANELWGDKYQVLVCTHTNKNNVHNHLILNSVSFIDGSKYHNSNVEIALLKQTNDDLCRKYGLSVIETKRALKEKEIAQSRIANYNRNSGKMNLIKNDIDETIKNTNKYQDFVDVLAQKSYYIKKSNNTLSISTPYFNRNIRLARAFGEDYTLDNIKNRIYYKNYEYETNNSKIYKFKIYDGVKINSELLKTSSFYRLYVHYLYVLGELPPKIHYEEKTAEYYKEINKFHKLADELDLISNNNLNTVEDVQYLKMSYLDTIKDLKVEKENYMKLYYKTNNEADKTILREKLDILTEEINNVNSKIQTCRRIIRKSEKIEKENQIIFQRKEINKNKIYNKSKNLSNLKIRNIINI